MSHNWREIRRTLSPEQEEATRQYVKSVVESVTLNQLREARSLTQNNLASILGINQGSVSKMEKRTDMYISTSFRPWADSFRSKPSFRKAKWRSSSST